MIHWSSLVRDKDIGLENTLNFLCSGINGTGPTKRVLTVSWVVNKQQPRIVHVG